MAYNAVEASRFIYADQYKDMSLRDLNQHVKYDMPVIDFLSSLALGDCQTIPLSSTVTIEPEAMLRYGIYTVPSVTPQNGLTVVEIGLRLSAEQRLDPAYALQPDRQVLSTELRSRKLQRDTVNEMYRSCGARMAQRISFAGHTLFAGMERRASSSITEAWTQLVYPQALRGTFAECLKEGQYRRRIGKGIPVWMNREILKFEDSYVSSFRKDDIAQQMALSALATLVEANKK